MRFSGAKLLISLAAAQGLAAPANGDTAHPLTAQGINETRPTARLQQGDDRLRASNELSFTEGIHAKEPQPLDNGHVVLGNGSAAVGSIKLKSRGPSWQAGKINRPHVGKAGYFQVAEWPGTWAGWRVFIPENFNMNEREVAWQLAPPGHPATLFKMNIKGEMIDVKTGAKMKREPFQLMKESKPFWAVAKSSAFQDEYSPTVNVRCSFEKPMGISIPIKDYIFCYPKWAWRPNELVYYVDTWRICDSAFTSFSGPPKPDGLGYVAGPFVTVGIGKTYNAYQVPTRVGPESDIGQCDYVLMEFILDGT